MTESKTTIIQSVLPKDPTDGQIYPIPNGGTIGGSIVIYLTTAKNEVLGTATQLVPVQNVSGHYTLMRASTKRIITKNNTLKISIKHYPFNSIQYLNYYGWVGHDTKSKPIILESAIYRVSHAIPIGDTINGYHLYERICLTLIKE